MPLFKNGTATPPLNETSGINAGSIPDQDSPEFFQAWLKQAIAASEAFTPETYTVLAAMRRPRGRLPTTSGTRAAPGRRLDDYLPEIFRSHGKE
ncbi:hypothetical protein CAP31_04075 [Sulfuriferula sp. AH1]|uniref:hypothetical protein n=1 Tax=Sulfuriferula sp. AH1 TaxID=1985873 RepID=UPI000B3B5415|nr:hypothetical protein [Sulfuriferula sp. AH1]ARU30937.1 hypothetical protein CAP31_04075 [Sulfuriferula sp. AH1]